MKKIFVIVPTLGTGGGEKVVVDILKNIEKSKYQVELYCLFGEKDTIYSEELKKEHIKIKYLNKKIGFDLRVIGNLIKIMKKERPDVVHTHLNVMQFVLPALILARIKIRVHTVHSIAEKESIGINRKIMWLAFKFFKVKPVGISDIVNKSIVNLYSLDESKVTCIYNGINLERYCSSIENNRKNINFICVGTLYSVKNQELIIRAFKKLHDKYKNTRLTIVGDGELRSYLEELLKVLKIEDVAFMKGIISNVESELKKADIFLMSSKYEGLPLSMLEAMATGLPVISTEVGGIPDIIKNMENGILVESENEKAFVVAMEQLIENKNLRIKMGKKSLEFSRKYDVRKMAREYEKIYDMN